MSAFSTSAAANVAEKDAGDLDPSQTQLLRTREQDHRPRANSLHHTLQNEFPSL